MDYIITVATNVAVGARRLVPFVFYLNGTTPKRDSL